MAVLFSAALQVAAQQSRTYREGNSWVEEITGTLPPARQLHVTTDLGSVQVLGNAPRISYVIRKRSYAPTEQAARRQFEHLRISARKSGASASIEGKAKSKEMGPFAAEFVVQVPRDVNVVKVQTRSGSLGFSSISASIVASTGGGVIKLDDLTGPMKISSAGGNIEAGKLGSELALKNGAGNLPASSLLRRSKGNDAGGSRASTIQTGAGSIQVRKCMCDLHVVSGGGNLNLGDIDGAVQAETQGGSVRLTSATGAVRVTTGGGSVELYKLSRGAQVETGAGPIIVEFIGDRGFTDSFLHTAAGDVTVCVSNALGVNVHATSEMANGRGILSDFPVLNITRHGGTYAPMSMSAEGAVNGGGPPLRIRTTIGQIALRRCQ